MDQVFAAIADPKRREILDRVSRGSLTASELAAPLGISVTGVLKHLRTLEEARLVTTRKVGRARWCELTPGGLDSATDWMSKRQQLWNRRLDRFHDRLSRLTDEDT